jgi:Tol biopolymer transport system component
MSIFHGERCMLYEADIATGVAHPLTGGKDGCEFSPVFSPDGRQLAYMRIREHESHAALLVANADGTNGRVLVPGDADNLAPAFVPRSSHLVLLRSAFFGHYSPVARSHRHDFDVFSVDQMTGQITAVTQKKFYTINSLSVSPDGHRVVLSMFDEYGDNFAIFSLDNATTSPSVVRRQDFHDITAATWSPDGHSLFFLGGRDQPDARHYFINVYRLTVASGDVEQVTRFTGFVRGYSVSADGAKIVALYDDSFYVLDLRTHGLSRVPLKLSS